MSQVGAIPCSGSSARSPSGATRRAGDAKATHAHHARVFRLTAGAALCACLLVLACGTSRAQSPPPSPSAPDAAALARATQNPVAALISVPFQNQFNFGVGPGDHLQYVLNIQPVIPMGIGPNWNWIHRTIVPLMYQPSVGGGLGNEFGLGDIQYQGFLTPAAAGPVIWGLGPVVQLPSATDRSLGQGKYALGAAAVLLHSGGPWVVGVLVNNVWSVGGQSDRPTVNQMLVQPFINYNFEGGWYATSSPIITANWQASSGEQWTVPIGAGVGRVFPIGRQPVNLQLSSYYNVEHPTGGPDWQLRLQFQLLFPR